MPTPARMRDTVAALLACAATFALTAIIDLALQPPFAGDRLHITGDYLFTVAGLPFAATTLALFVTLRRLHDGRDGRLGAIGFGFATAGLIGLFIALVASLVTADERALSPLYPLATLATFIGVVLYAVAASRAHVLPRWAGALFAVGWLVGGPIAPGRGLFLLQTLTCLAIAAALARPPSARPLPTPPRPAPSP